MARNSVANAARDPDVAERVCLGLEGAKAAAMTAIMALEQKDGPGDVTFTLRRHVINALVVAIGALEGAAGEADVPAGAAPVIPKALDAYLCEQQRRATELQGLLEVLAATGAGDNLECSLVIAAREASAINVALDSVEIRKAAASDAGVRS